MANELAPAPAVTGPQIPSPLDQVAAGQLPAVSLPPIVDRKADPLQEWVLSSFHDLAKLNLAYHEYPDEARSIIYNPKIVTDQQLDKAHKAGQLDAVAPMVGGPAPEAQAAPAAAPAPDAAPAAPAAQPAPSAAPAGVLSGAKVPTNRRMQSARLQNAKTPGADRPNPVPDQLAKRPI